MENRDGKHTRIAFLILLAALVVALAVIEALAGHGDGPQGTAAAWQSPLRGVDDALARKDVSAAVSAWHDAYLAGLGSRRWEGMLAVGGAALRVGEVAPARWAAHAKARQAYLSALLRARQARSLEGVLHATEAFAALGDTGVVTQCLRIAEDLVAGDPEGRGTQRVRALRERLTEQSFARGDSPAGGR